MASLLSAQAQSYEVDLTTGGWTDMVGGLTFSVSTDVARTGSKSLKVSAGEFYTGMVFFGPTPGPGSAVSPGDSVTMEAHWYTPPGSMLGEVALYGTVYDATPTLSAFIGPLGTITEAEGWNSISTTYDVPAGGAYAAMAVSSAFPASVPAGQFEHRYFDDFSLVGVGVNLQLVFICLMLDTVSGSSPPNAPNPGWRSTTYFPARLLPYLSEFTDTEGPHNRSSIQYRNDRGSLLAIHPYEEEASLQNDSDTEWPYGLERLSDGSLFFTSWANATVWRIAADGTTIWMREAGLSYSPYPCLSPDGSLFYVQDDASRDLLALDVTDGSTVWSRPITGAVGGDNFFYGFVNHPSGDLIVFTANKPRVYRINVSTGAATLVLDLNDLELPLAYNRVFDVDAAPDGSGFAAVAWTSAFPAVSAIVEFDWDLNVTNIYTADGPGPGTYAGGGFGHVSYSGDGTYLFAVEDNDNLLYRFNRGSGNVGGGAPFMNLAYMTPEEWAADDYTPFTGPNAVMYPLTAGLVAYGTVESRPGGWGFGVQIRSS